MIDLDEFAYMWNTLKYDKTNLAKHFNVSVVRIRRLASKARKQGYYLESPQRYEAGELVREWNSLKFTKYDLAKKYEVSSQTITNWLRLAKKDGYSIKKTPGIPEERINTEELIRLASSGKYDTYDLVEYFGCTRAQLQRALKRAEKKGFKFRSRLRERTEEGLIISATRFIEDLSELDKYIEKEIMKVLNREGFTSASKISKDIKQSTNKIRNQLRKMHLRGMDLKGYKYTPSLDTEDAITIGNAAIKLYKEYVSVNKICKILDVNYVQIGRASCRERV